MKQMRLTIHDEYLFEGLRMQAIKDGVTPGAYVLSLVEADIERRLGYKLVGHWSDGKVVTETNFYTPHDFMQSLSAFKFVYTNPQPSPTGSHMVGYEAWCGEKLLRQVP